MKVPVAIAIAKDINSRAINRVENKKENNFLFICKELRFYKSATKVLKNVDFYIPTFVNLIQN
jgi:hypothetical protein